jgi:hypothetical protein
MTFLYILPGLAVCALFRDRSIGGDIMIVPVLIYLFDMSQHKAQRDGACSAAGAGGSPGFLGVLQGREWRSQGWPADCLGVLLEDISANPEPSNSLKSSCEGCLELCW